MLRSRRTLLLSALALALTAQAARAQASGHFDPDDPRTRAQWNDQWFGKVTPDYLLFKNRAAAAEILKWPRSFPSARATAQPLAAPAASTTSPWTNLGPTQSAVNGYSDFNGDIDSGRPVSVVVDPTDRKTIYLATSGGGVWKSTNADTTSTADWTWTPITDGLPASSGTGGNISCGALAMSPANHLVLYLALGDAFDAAGTGIFKTADGGATWTAATITGGTPIRSYDICALDASNVLVGTNAGLFRSTDGGVTYAKIAGSPGGQIWSVQKFDATHLIATSQGTDQGIWYSSDAGATWTAATVTYQTGTTAGRITVSTSPASTTQAWGEYEDTASGNIAPGLLKTIDQGHTWTFVAAPATASSPNTPLFKAESGDGGQGFYNHCLAVSPTNINDVFIGANLDFYRTTDGGANWQWMSSWDTAGRPYAHADNHCWGWSSDGKLYIGNDGGLAIYLDPLRASASLPTKHDATFLDGTRNKGLATHLVYYLGSTQATNAADSGARISIGLQDNGTRVRVDTGTGLANSSTFNESIGGDGFGTIWHTTDATKVLGSVYYNDIEKSIDGGATFNPSNSGIAETSSSNAPFVTHLALGNNAAPDTVYAHSNTKVYQSTNFAGTWTAMTTTGLPSSYYIRNIGASRSTNAVAIASNGGRVFLYYPGSGTWTGSTTDITGGALNTGAVWFDTQSDQTVYFTSVAVNSAVHHLWKSANGGSTWTSIDGSSGVSNGLPFGIPIHCIQNMPGDSTTLFAGTDFGVYQSTDSGASWSRFGTGLPLVATRDLYIAPDKSYIRVATFGRGVWQASLATGPSVSVSPGAATLVTGGTVSITPTVTNTTTNNTVNWTATGGTILPANTATGVAATYTAPGTAGSYTVTATTVETPAGTANSAITVVNPSAVTVTLSPTPTASTTTSSTVNFTASVSGITDTGVNWTSSGGSFNVTTGGAVTWTAPGTGGSYTVTATANGAPTRSATTTVSVIDPASITVSVAPSTKTLLAGGSQSFTATVSAGSVTWSLAGAGAITPNGTSCTYNAPGTFATNQTATLTATATLNNAKTASATIMLKTLDINGDASVDVRDLLALMSLYGKTDATSLSAGDLNGDGKIDDADLTLFLANF